MNIEPDTKWLAQLRKGFLELCVLIILQRRDSSYGFELLQLFQQAGLDINEGTLYPLLNRMHKNGWLDSDWQTPEKTGHPRRFYSLSPLGKAQLPAMIEAHTQHHLAIQKLLESK